ncbi:MAG: Vault protein inter-alpha-trypsin, partial [Planctomycetaceae bacterium]|nr:Vault protein inter-alpha-trypsin [Planctomycetaceae bacterium]
MSQESEYIPNETRFAELLRAADADLPPPDPDFLRVLQQRSLDAFLAEAELLPPDDREAPIGNAVLKTRSSLNSPAPALRNWRQFMFALAVRSSLAVSAAFVMFAAWLVPFPGANIKAAVPFSEVLSELREAQSLHLELVKEGQTTEVWVRAPGLVRLDETPQRYRIAAGSRLWQIDEAANTVTESDSPWFLTPETPIDLLGLLEVGVKDASAMLKARP